jgi:hypothetical protein
VTGRVVEVIDDTPGQVHGCKPDQRHDRCMSARKGRRQRPPSGPTVAVQVRVTPETHALMEDGARTLGISLAAYVEEVFRRLDMDPRYGVPAWGVDQIQREQLEDAQLELRSA